MSTNEQLVLRAEQAAQQTAENKAEIEAMVSKLEQVQAPAIAAAKEDIKQALIEKGQSIDYNVPFSEYGNKVRAIDNSGINTSDATATSNDLLNGKIAYGSSGKITGNIPTVTATLNNNITTVPKGYIAEAQTLTVKAAAEHTVSENVVTINKGYQASQKEITVGVAKAASTIIPGNSDITISKGTYLSGDQTIKGDPNLIAGNIKEGVSIFGVTGNLEASSGTSGTSSPHVLVSNDNRWRWFGIDSMEPISYVQSATYCCNILAINGNAFKVFGPVDYDNKDYRCMPLTNRSDISHVYYREDNKYLFLTESGELYGVDSVWNKSIPLDLQLITTGVDSVCPSNDSRYWVKKGDVVEYWINYEYGGSVNNIAQIISNKADGGGYNMGYTFMAVKTSGELVTVQNTSEYGTDIYVQTLSPAPPTGSWKDVGFYGYEAYDGGGCYGLATDTQGNLYYASINGYELAMISSLSFTKIEGISDVKTKPGYCITGVDFSWDDETGEELYIPSVSTAALVIDGAGHLWKIHATITNNGSSLSGIVKEQIGEDTDWVWCEPSINRNNVAIAQKGNKLVRIQASNTNELTLQIDTIRGVTGTVENIYSPSSGDWCIVTK